jgi:hypothetical protein
MGGGGDFVLKIDYVEQDERIMLEILFTIVGSRRTSILSVIKISFLVVLLVKVYNYNYTNTAHGSVVA